MVLPRESTRSFPSNKPRIGWVERERVAPHFTDEARWVEFEYEVYESAAERDRARGEPFLIVNHKAQLREDHQRVVIGPNGGLMHVEGIEVQPSELETFMQGPLWYTKDPDGKWRNTLNINPALPDALDGFMFPAAPWAGGQLEELDPNWQRETFALSIDEQVVALKQRRLDRAERRQESGDKRGTTLNLTIGASADDAAQLTDDNVAINATVPVCDATTFHVGSRWTGVTIPNAATIDAATLTVVIPGTGDDEPLHQVRGEAADDAATFTTASNSVDARGRTTAVVQWNSTNLGATAGSAWEWGAAAGAPTAGANLNAIVQEIVDRAGWASGNALVMIWEQHTGDAARDLRTRHYDNGTSDAAKLDIDYTAGGPVVATIGVATLTLTTFAPIVSAPRRVTPATASLVLTPFAPTVSAPRRATIGAASLSLTPFAPTVLAPRLATIGLAELALTTFEPSVVVGKRVTIEAASLTLTPFAPTVLAPRLATIGAAALELTSFEISVISTLTATPGTAVLILATFAPIVSTPRLAIIAAASLVLAAFEIIVSAPRLATIGKASLILTAFAPLVSASLHVRIVIGAASLILMTFAPTIGGNAPQLVTIGTASLVLTTFAPLVAVLFRSAILLGGIKSNSASLAGEKDGDIDLAAVKSNTIELGGRRA